MKAKYFLLRTPKLRSEVDIKYQKQKSAKYWTYTRRFGQFLCFDQTGPDRSQTQTAGLD